VRSWLLLLFVPGGHVGQHLVQPFIVAAQGLAHHREPFAELDDDRIVPALAWMRPTRADEVPQLWNVVKGEMSLVGPRTERPELVAEIVQRVPGYVRRSELPPGLTGLAQVHGRYATDAEYKLGYDLQYLVNWSIVLDVEILVRTIWVVLSRRV
jgi:lipopolysaccharide/colanic/teichoic acid biosynthesis glycosyltransferase